MKEETITVPKEWFESLITMLKLSEGAEGKERDAYLACALAYIESAKSLIK